MGHDEDDNIKSTPTMMSPNREELSRQPSEASCYMTEEEEEDANLQLGPKCSIKEHLEKDKDDESLRRWKEQLLGNVNAVGDVETLEADVKIVSLTIICPGRDDIVLQISDNEDPKGVWFTLKEGTQYRLRFAIKVSNNIVSGLRYTNTVWKTGLKVDNSKEMLGTFSPQAEPYIHEMPEETTPSGYFARGSYSAKTKTTTTSATWKSTTHSVSRKNGQNKQITKPFALDEAAKAFVLEIRKKHKQNFKASSTSQRQKL